jgi:hypothetical protein
MKNRHEISYEVTGNSYEQIDHAAWKVASDYFPDTMTIGLRLSAHVDGVIGDYPTWHAWCQAWAV